MNYSLAQDLRNQERRQQQKTNQRQKQQQQHDRVMNCDPRSVYRRLEKWHHYPPTSQKEIEMRTRLQADWQYMIAKGIHKEKMEPLKTKFQKLTEPKGQKSIYYNPELNPLGTPPQNWPNLTVTDKFHKTPSQKDPLIDELSICPPPGSPPRYYPRVLGGDSQRTIQGEEALTKKRQRVS